MHAALTWNGACSILPIRTLWEHQMGYQEIDREIAHLEVVFGLISARDRFPLSYWHQRLRALHRESMVPTQRERVARLEAMLRSLGASEETVRV
jgi:hypothetical protein